MFITIFGIDADILKKFKIKLSVASARSKTSNSFLIAFRIQYTYIFDVLLLLREKTKNNIYYIPDDVCKNRRKLVIKITTNTAEIYINKDQLMHNGFRGFCVLFESFVRCDISPFKSLTFAFVLYE